VNRELAMHSSTLAQKPQLVVLNKLDVASAPDLADSFCKALHGVEVLRISAAGRLGLDALKVRLLQEIEKLT
jgi:GTP-binding protein